MVKEEAALVLPVEQSKAYKEAMRKKLAALMKAHDMNQVQLVKKLKERGLDADQGSLSLYLSGRKSIPLSIIVHLCDIFQVSLAELVDEDFGGAKQPAVQAPQIYSEDLLNLVPSLGDSFITNPDSPEFHGYLQTYYFYMQPTMSYETKMLTGTIILRACGNVCEAQMDLNTGKTAGGKPLQKHYRGRVIIAKAIDAVYILLTSPIEGDLSVISFRHFHLPHQPLDCRIAAVLTNETGEFHSPTMHRMFLSRTPIQPEHMPLLMPHLQLNSSAVNIRKEHLERLRRNEPEYAQLLDALKMIPPTDTYYWTEDYVMGVAKHFLPPEQIPVFFTRIREITVQRSSNKASRRANSLVRNLLLSLGYYHDHDI